MLTKINNFLTSDRLQAIGRHPALILTLRLLQLAFVIGVAFFLVNKLSAIGWQEVLASLPTNPLYYLFFLAFYFAIPTAELLAYRTIWGMPMSRYFVIFARKRVYNFALLSYSGEAVLALWAQKNLPIKTMTIIQTIKDSNILSALASNSFTLILLILFFVTDQISLITEADPDYRFYLGLAAAVGLVLVPLILKFRRHIISLEQGIAKKVFLIHLTRFVSALLFQLFQWMVILPEVPITMWLLFLTAQLVLSRVPFLPNTDLLYLGLGLTLAGYVDAPEAIVAAMFVAAGALSQLLNAAIYVLTSFHPLVTRGTLYAQQKRTAAHCPDAPAPAPEAEV